jgi:hypothetical protein
MKNSSDLFIVNSLQIKNASSFEGGVPTGGSEGVAIIEIRLSFKDKIKLGRRSFKIRVKVNAVTLDFESCEGINF